jgi:hypothetical protein
MSRSFLRALPFAAALFVAAAFVPSAAHAYQGYGDTGWTEDNQRDCCDDAVADAQQDSANACTNAGGQPKIRSNFDRGLCNWNAQGDGDDTVYRCTATADVDCW